MLHRLIICVAVIGLVQDATAGDIDTAYLRGSQGDEAPGSVYPAEVVARSYPTNAPAPSYPVDEIASSPPYVPPRTAADGELSIAKAPPHMFWSWTGAYAGFHLGGTWGVWKFADPFGGSIFGDSIQTPGFLGGGQIGYNWRARGSAWVLGVEGDISGLDSDGTNTCLAYSGFYVSSNCHSSPSGLGTIAGRLGYAAGASGHSLLYVKGGAAWVQRAGSGNLHRTISGVSA